MSREDVVTMLQEHKAAVSECTEQLGLLQSQLAFHVSAVSRLERALGQPELPLAPQPPTPPATAGQLRAKDR